MSAALFIGRVGGIAAALGVGVAILNGTAAAGADTDGPDSSRATASTAPARSESAPTRAPRQFRAVESEASVPSTRSRAASTIRDLVESVPDQPAAVATEVAAISAVSAVPAPAATAVTVPAPSAALPAESDGPPTEFAQGGPTEFAQGGPTEFTQGGPTEFAQGGPTEFTQGVVEPTPPNPDATVATPYGALGQWMINKEGQVADWIGQPYCGPGSNVGNCGADTPGAKTIQEPINTIFVVKARTEYEAELQLNWSLVVSGFGPSPFSSIGYSGILGTESYKQMPRGGPLGLGLLLPLPFGLFQDGLTGSLLGVGAAYRDAAFFLANSHLRTFGGEPDGNGNYIFTASVSEENLDSTGTGLLPTHGYESFDQAREKLTNNMVKAGWISGASAGALVNMNNEIAPSDPTYTTGDHDGYAQVIVIGSLFGSGPVRSTKLV